ncbi:uncharacterized protein BDV17DRAFT_217890 [Aspergillus undulatus]|uniref:uncharacterized protein n=1 Tax=Aspergillus undulatus TaxID=1810928 RepID=UPI003CCCA831
MLFNLGMTADAAAAHNSELASSQSETQLSMPSRNASPRPFSFTNLPSWVSRSRSVREKGTETERPERPRYEQRRSMPITTVEPISSSDEDQRSTAGPSPVRHTFGNNKYSKQPSPSRPKTVYQLAHPATNARHKRLKLRPKLLLQLQQVSATSRPLPVYDVLPSTLFMPKVARKLPAILCGKRGLGPNDLIVTTSDLYQGDGVDKNVSSDEEEDHNEVVATICQPYKEDALSKGKAEICLNTGTVLEATPLPNGSYEFTANTDSGLVITRWVRRGPKKRRLSAPPGSVGPEDTRRFTFSVIDPTTRRHPVIASMAHNHLEIFDKYSLPSTAPSSPTSAISVISDVSEMDLPLDQQVMETDENLRLLITVTSIWVAFREGWSHNFRYNDLAPNGKGVRSPSVSKNVSAAAPGSEEDRAHSRRNSFENHAADPNRRIVTWSATGSQSPAADRSTQYGSLSKRSNSTGAAFIQRSNKRYSSTNRHSVLPTPRQSYDEHQELKTVQQNSICRSWSQRKADKEDAKLKSNGIYSTAAHRSTQEKIQTLNGHQESSRSTKGKRRHRLSNLFDFLTRKSGHHHD